MWASTGRSALASLANVAALPDDDVVALAARQHGTFSRAQSLAMGIDDGAISRRLRGGRWLRVHPGVYILPGAPPSFERDLWAAHLAIGPHSVVSHECAAARRGLRAVPQARLVLTNRHGRHHRIPDVVVHQIDDVLDHHVEVIDGLPTTTVARTIVDCASVVSLVRLERLAEQALRERLVTTRQIHDVVADVCRRGKPGMRAMGAALHKFGPGTVVPDSKLEAMLLAALLAGGNPAPVPQFAHPGRHPGVGRVDFAYPDAKVVLEADGRPWHQRIADIRRDRARDNEAARSGWLTLRFMAEELQGDPDDVGATVRDVLTSRRTRR